MTPYTVKFVNLIDIPVDFVLAYELWSGLILLEQTSNIQPGNTGTIHTSAHCIEVRQYAFSVWDQADNELFVSPTMTVQQINQIEAQQGTFRQCVDTINVFYS